MATPEEIILEEQAKKSAATPVDLGLRTLQPQNKGLTTTSISDTTTQTRYTQPVKPKFQFTNDNVLEALMAEKPVNKPVLDAQNQTRIMNRGKLDALGRVAINIGDSLTLGMGEALLSAINRRLTSISISITRILPIIKNAQKIGNIRTI